MVKVDPEAHTSTYPSAHSSLPRRLPAAFLPRLHMGYLRSDETLSHRLLQYGITYENTKYYKLFKAVQTSNSGDVRAMALDKVLVGQTVDTRALR